VKRLHQVLSTRMCLTMHRSRYHRSKWPSAESSWTKLNPSSHRLFSQAFCHTTES
jgi:hypothetical protein